MNDPTSPMPARKGHSFGAGGPGSAIPAVTDFFSPPLEPDEIGRLGDYRVIKPLGKGGMGYVFLAEDTRLRRPVALKLMAPALAVDEKSRVRFLREARAAARIQHENVVVIYEVDEANGLPFIAMERLKGLSLEDYLDQKGPPALSHVLRIAREVATGLSAAHERGLVHRDVKPGNIWLEAPTGRVRLLDFGLAVQPDVDRRVTSEGAVVGTPAYMAPEQARGEAVDHRADLFSLGVVMYRLCTGRSPFTGANMVAVLLSVANDVPAPVRAHNPSIPVGLDRLIHQLLAKTPKDRPQSAAEVIELLDGSAAGAPTPGRSGLPPAVQPTPPVPSLPSGSNVSVVPDWLREELAGPETPVRTGADVSVVPGWLQEVRADHPATPSPNRPGIPDNSRPPGVPDLGAGTLPGSLPAPRAAAADSPTALSTPAPAGPAAPTYSPAHPPPAYPPSGPTVQVSVASTVEAEGGSIREFDSSRGRASKSDPWGVASLVLGIVSMVSLLFCLCGGYWVAAPLAFAGVATGIFGRGGYRVAGLILNGLVLIPGIAALIMGAALIAMLFGGSYVQQTGKNPAVEKTGTGTKQEPPVVRVAPVTGVDPPKPLPSTTPGTLQLDIPKLSGNRKNLELFVDGQLDGEFAQLLNQFRPIDTHTVRLTPGDHAVVLKKNGIEVYSKTVTVKKPADGTTFLPIDLVVTGTVVLRSTRPVFPGVEARVYVDDQSIKEWPVGADTVELSVEVGTRVVEVRTSKPVQAVIFTDRVKIEKPGARETRAVKN